MKAKIFTVAVTLLVLLGLSSCKKDPEYYNLSELDLDFVNYEEGQSLKFIDTSGVTINLKQRSYDRGYSEKPTSLGSSNEFQERYGVSYYPATTGTFYFSLGVNAKTDYEINSAAGSIGNPNDLLRRYDFHINVGKDKPLPTPIEVNGKTYNNVYSIRAQRFMTTDNRTVETVILLWNKEYGLIQVQFPSGKSITRTD